MGSEQTDKSQDTRPEAPSVETKSSGTHKKWTVFLAITCMMAVLGFVQIGQLGGKASGGGEAMGCGGSEPDLGANNKSQKPQTKQRIQVNPAKSLEDINGQGNETLKVLTLPQLEKQLKQKRLATLKNPQTTLKMEIPAAMGGAEAQKPLTLPELEAKLKAQEKTRLKYPIKAEAPEVHPNIALGSVGLTNEKSKVVPLPALLKQLKQK